MAVREFNGATDDIVRAAGALSGMQYGTVIGLVKSADSVTDEHAFFQLRDPDNNINDHMAVERWATLYEWWDGFNYSNSATGTADLGWQIVIARKPTGTNVPRFSIHDRDTDTWTHQDGEPSPLLVDAVAVGISGNVSFDHSPRGRPWSGRVAAVAAWSNTLPWSPDAAGDAAIEAAGLKDAYQAWLDATPKPSAVWRFNQDSISTAVVDDTGNGANQILISGTTVIVGDDPPGFKFGATVHVDHGLSMGHAVTVDASTDQVTFDTAHGLLMGHSVEVRTAPPPPPPPPPPVIQAERLIASWTPDGGVARILTRGGGDAGQVTRPGVIGVDLPPDAQFEQDLAAGDGSILTGRRRLPREVIFGVWLRGDTLTEAETRRRQLALDFDPKRDGTFTWALPDGTSRSLRCRTSEFEAEQGHRLSAHLWGRWRIVLRARDPYWLGEERGIQFSAPSGDDFFGGATAGAPPYFISESTIFGQTVVAIEGDETAWPVWELHGPMTTATLENVTTGKILDLTPNLLVGETVTIRTDPRVIASQKFTDDTGANVWATVAGQFPELWSLMPGPQTVDVTAAGSDPNTMIVLRYRARFLTA